MKTINKYFFKPEIGKQYFYIGEEEWCDEDETYADKEVIVVEEIIDSGDEKANRAGVFYYKVKSIVDGKEWEVTNLSLLTTSEFVEVRVNKTHTVKL